MKSVRERRRNKRWQVAVLVRCSLPKHEDELFELEMWAKDVNEKGMKLEWSRGLNVAQLNKTLESQAAQTLRFDDIDFKKGQKVTIQDLFYDDDGSPFITGKVLWAKRVASRDSWNLGIQFDDLPKQSKQFKGAFKDFLCVVKNPLEAIKKASRKN